MKLLVASALFVISSVSATYHSAYPEIPNSYGHGAAFGAASLGGAAAYGGAGLLGGAAAYGGAAYAAPHNPACCPVPAPLPTPGPVFPNFCSNHQFVNPWLGADGCPPPPVVNFAPPFPVAHPFQVSLDPTVCDIHPFPPFFKPAPLLPPPLYDVYTSLPPPPCFPHPWCIHDWHHPFFFEDFLWDEFLFDEWYHHGHHGHHGHHYGRHRHGKYYDGDRLCKPACPCHHRLWGRWCCNEQFACLSPEDKWDIAESFDPFTFPEEENGFRFKFHKFKKFKHFGK